MRAGNWLTRDQAETLLSAPPSTLMGLRDRAVLGLLIGCGLRRDELANLTFAHLQQREGRWVIVDIIGKGRRVRTVPVRAGPRRWSMRGLRRLRFRPVWCFGASGRVGGWSMERVLREVQKRGGCLRTPSPT